MSVAASEGGEIECRLIHFNPRRLMRGVEAAKVLIDGQLLWMSVRDIKKNIEQCGPLPGLLDALAAYRKRVEFCAEGD